VTEVHRDVPVAPRRQPDGGVRSEHVQRAAQARDDAGPVDCPRSTASQTASDSSSMPPRQSTINTSL
jgi:hypothetical protein